MNDFPPNPCKREKSHHHYTLNPFPTCMTSLIRGSTVVKGTMITRYAIIIIIMIIIIKYLLSANL